MKILAFAVKAGEKNDLAILLDHIINLPLDARIEETATTRLRIDEMSRKRNNILLLDFVKFRASGPGKASDGRPTEDFTLATDEYFGEETAIYYDVNKCHMAIQYNHYGPRISAIASYLSMFAANIPNLDFDTVELIPVLRKDQADRLRRIKIVKSFEYKVHVPAVVHSDGRARQSLNAILSDNVVASAETLTVTLSAKKASPLSLSAVKAQITSLLRDRSLIEKLKISGRETAEGPIDPIDMLEAQLMAELPVQPKSKGRRFDRNERWAALAEAYQSWQSQMS